MEDFDLDLDTLAPKPKRVKLNGEIIEVMPPSLSALIELMQIAGKFKSVSADATAEETMGMIEELKKVISLVVPDIMKHQLSISQLTALMTMIINTSKPADVTQMEKNGVSVSTDEKKIPLD